MGCVVGKQAQAPVPPLRRRLSLGEVDGEDTPVPTKATEQDRSFLTKLSQKQVFDFMTSDPNAGRRFSLGSQTDSNLNQVTSFGSKEVRLEGQSFDVAEERIGYACKKGLKPEAPNQDSFLIMKVDDMYALYGVFDGHGRYGHDVSNFVKDNLPKILFSQKEFVQDPQEALERTFEKTQSLIEKATALKTIDAARSGTTCSIVLHCIQQKMLYVAHVGDSRVVLGRRKDGEQCSWSSKDLTIDHKPDLPEERKRIEKNGGVVIYDGVWNHRVYAKGKRDDRGKRYPGLNMSRAMGDLNGFHDAGISAAPDVNMQVLAGQGSPSKDTINIESDLVSSQPSIASASSHPSVSSHGIDPAVDKFVLLCSDGVWEFISSEAAVQAVANFKPEEATVAAEHLAKLAWDHWMREMEGQVVDDITAVLVHLA